MAHLPPSDTPDSKDPWDVVKSGYDAERFYTRSTNSHDHSVQRQVKLSPALDAAVHHAIGTIHAYKTFQDVVRDSIIHRLHALDEFPADHPAFAQLVIEQRQAEMDEMKQLRESWSYAIKTLDDLTGKMIEDGEYEEAMDLLDRNNDEAAEMAPVYQDRLAEVIRRRYQHARDTQAQRRDFRVVELHSNTSGTAPRG